MFGRAVASPQGVQPHSLAPNSANRWLTHSSCICFWQSFLLSCMLRKPAVPVIFFRDQGAQFYKCLSSPSLVFKRLIGSTASEKGFFVKYVGIFLALQKYKKKKVLVASRQSGNKPWKHQGCIEIHLYSIQCFKLHNMLLTILPWIKKFFVKGISEKFSWALKQKSTLQQYPFVVYEFPP